MKSDRKIWDGSEPLECVAIVPEVPNTYSLAFRSPSGAWFDFLPGQFVTLEVPVPGGPLYRTYTISSSPSRPLTLSVTVKAQGDSVGSRWLIDNLKIGDRINSTGPLGLFHLAPTPGAKQLFISAGSGITPMMSMATWLFDFGDEPDICFINCAKRPSELIFGSLLRHMATRVTGMKLHFVVSEDDPYAAWAGYRGRLNQLMLGLMCQDYLERDVYCCGPEEFMQSVRDMLNALGYDMSRYRQESFDTAVSASVDVEEINDVIPQEAQAAEIIFSTSGITAACSETDTVLTTAKAVGLNLPSGCRSGLCGTCKVRKVSGNVHMVHNGGISEDDLEAGYILACCSHPIGKVDIAV